MRKSLWILISAILFFILTGVSSDADDLNGWAILNNNYTEKHVNNIKTSETDSFNQNYFLSLDRDVTPMLSYRLTLRTDLLDSSSTDAAGAETKSYNRMLEPAIDLSLRNHFYDARAGYKREEQWDTASLQNSSRETKVFYYSRFNYVPKDLPSLTLQYDRLEDFDHLAQKQKDDTSDQYIVSSSYSLPAGDLQFRSNITYIHDVDKSPIKITRESKRDTLAVNYFTGYSGTYWNRRATYSAGYQGNYSRSKVKRIFGQAGSVLFERSPFQGLYDQNNSSTVDLGGLPRLVDDNFIVTTPTAINLSTTLDQQIGIQVLSGRTVDRLYIYVNQDVSGDLNLTNPSNWEVRSSNANVNGAWSTTVTISSVTVTLFDALNSIYRYELIFTSPQNALYFKAISRATSTVLNVEVTEIEAYGTDVVTRTTSDTTTSYTHGISLATSVKPINRLTLSLTYSLDRRDQNPISEIESITGAFGNIFSNSISGNDPRFISNITRNYGISTTWLTHRLLTTTVRLNRNENFDNINQTDFDNNTYELTLYSRPLPTLDANLSLLRSDSFNFGDKDSTHDSIILTVGSELYEEVNMVTDLGHTRTESFSSNSITKSYFLNGNLDAQIRNDLSATLTYNLSRIDTDGSAENFKEALMIVNYRPGRFINLTGNFRITDSSDDLRTTEGLIIDWLPLSALKLNLSLEHSDSEQDPSVTNAVNGFVIYYFQKFANLRVGSGYSQSKGTIETENFNLNANLNCRF